jgi:hypothetical protein
VTIIGGVIAEWIIIMLGQHMEGVSTMWHYISATAAMLVPGATILNGWPGLPYGQLGPGAKPPCLDIIVMAGAASMAQLDAFVDVVLQLKPGFVGPELLGQGKLRPMARAMGAMLMMYYQQSYDASEVTKVTTRMRHAMIHVRLAANDAEAHQKLVVWATKLKDGFDVSNLHLTMRTAHSDNTQLVHMIQRLATDVATIGKHAIDANKANASMKEEMTTNMQNIR